MNIDTMNTKQLRHLKERIDAVIADKQAQARSELAARFHAMAADAGLDLSDVVGRPKKIKRTGQKWRDTKTGAVWSGMGRTPKNFDRKRAEKVG